MMGQTRCPMTRREFLYYVWASSLALSAAQTGGALLWYALPRFKPGTYGGIFTIDVADLPTPDGPPKPFYEGRFWLTYIDSQAANDSRHPIGYTTQAGWVVLVQECPHLGCTYKWVPFNDRFECPCHADKFLRDGTRIHRPAMRDLDKFPIRAVDADGRALAVTEVGDANVEAEVGWPLVLPEGTAAILIDTGRRIRGRVNDGPSITMSGEY
jgi:cytochrome b6-f complex iron-sulfur subunit